MILGTTQTFRGFLIQARDLTSNMLIGTFVVGDPNTQQNLNCDPVGVATVSHLLKHFQFHLESIQAAKLEPLN